MIELRKRLPTDYKDRPRLLSTPTVKIVPSYQQQQNKPKLLDQLRDAPCVRVITAAGPEHTYSYWVRRFIFYHHVHHPAEMAEPEIWRWCVIWKGVSAFGIL